MSKSPRSRRSEAVAEPFNALELQRLQKGVASALADDGRSFDSIEQALASDFAHDQLRGALLRRLRDGILKSGYRRAHERLVRIHLIESIECDLAKRAKSGVVDLDSYFEGISKLQLLKQSFVAGEPGADVRLAEELDVETAHESLDMEEIDALAWEEALNRVVVIDEAIERCSKLRDGDLKSLLQYKVVMRELRPTSGTSE